jgi:hypothetical protein
MKSSCGIFLVVMFGSASLAACGGGGGGGSPSPAPAPHQITISWNANREAAVNSPGGGYKVVISGQPVIDVPYPSGTSVTTTLMSGNYTATVTAYSAIHPSTGLPATGGSGSTSLPSTTLSINVP